MNKTSTKTRLSQGTEAKSNLKEIFCYLSVALLPFILFSYRFLPKVKTIKIFGYEWDFNGFPNSYSFLFAFLSKLAPLLFIVIFYLNPKPLKFFGKEIQFKNFLIPTALLYCYQLIFVVAPVDKIDEGFYTELVGWSSAFVMTLIVVFSKELFNLVDSYLTILYIKTTFQSKKLKVKIRNMTSFILNIRDSKSHKIDKDKFDKEMWELLDKNS